MSEPKEPSLTSLVEAVTTAETRFNEAKAEETAARREATQRENALNDARKALADYPVKYQAPVAREIAQRMR